MHDLLHGAFHFEGKIWHTLPALAWKPGELTRRYIDGQRAHFVSPMALFLFSVFLMFAVFQIAGISAPDDLGPPVQMGDAKSAQEQAQQQLEGLREARDSMGRNSPATPLIEAQIERLEKQAGASAEASAEAGNVVSDVFAGQRDGAADAAAAGAGEARPNAAG